MKIIKERLLEIIESHGKWSRNDPTGKRADLRGADLRGADLQGADLSQGIYQVVGPGCVGRCTTYDSINDHIICGCWSNSDGNTLAAFKNRIESVYGQNGSNQNAKYYAQYQAAIAFFEEIVAAEEK